MLQLLGKIRLENGGFPGSCIIIHPQTCRVPAGIHPTGPNVCVGWVGGREEGETRKEETSPQATPLARRPLSEQQDVLFPQLLEPCPSLPFINAPPC